MNPRAIDEMGWAMGQVYASVSDRILINLARHFKRIKAGQYSGAWDYQIRMLAQVGQVRDETIKILYQSLAGADEVLKELLTESIASSLEKVEPQLRKAAEAGLLTGNPPVMAPNQLQAFDAYYKQSADKLNLVNTTMLDSTMDVYQGTVSDIVGRMNRTQGILNAETGEVVSGVTTMNQAVKDGVRRMVDNGITGFIDSAGHHWTPEAYVNMDIRTTIANVGRQAVFETMEGYGDDLYCVSWHDGARPLCYPWQGKVISRSDWSGEVEDLDGEKVHVYRQSETTYGQAAGLFGINCGHYPMPFIPGFSKARQPEQNEEQNAKEYAESQEQRTLERRLREEKRDLEVLKAQGASKEEIEQQKEAARAARDNLDAFCDQTGRSRRSGREGTPVKATWPDGYEPPKTRTRNYIQPEAPINIPPVSAPVIPSVPAAPPDPSVVTFPNTPATADIITDKLANSGIQKRDLTAWSHKPTEQEIINEIAGADRTSGSCASVALAYAGNRGGYQVHDFRGGASMDFFATKDNTEAIAKIPGIDGICKTNAREIKTANELLSKMVPGKEYWLGTGRHASIVRCDPSGTGYQYLELQSATDNGWHTLDDLMLRYRFGCVKKRGYALSNRLMEIDKLIKSPDFAETLKYINTAADQQMKGAGGGIK